MIEKTAQIVHREEPAKTTEMENFSDASGAAFSYEDLLLRVQCIFWLSIMWNVAILQDNIAHRLQARQNRLSVRERLPRSGKKGKRRKKAHRSYQESEWWHVMSQLETAAQESKGFFDNEDNSAAAELARKNFIHWSTKFR